MTLEQIANYPQVKDGTIVEVSIDQLKFKGKVVGLSTQMINPVYIIECTDGTLPNETYPYKVCSVPLSEFINSIK